MWDEMESWLTDAFGGLKDMFGSGDGESGNLMKGVTGALKLGMMGSMGGKAHSNVQAAPFHYQSNANPITALKTGFDYMKNDINVGQGFNDVKNLC
ncbi:hypothetical protein DQR71_09000 [Salmonella enterica subsp. enterica serovar Kingston]|nr:hypothetical protein [Salmonella enterica subsp. enterica serovar Kingston]